MARTQRNEWTDARAVIERRHGEYLIVRPRSDRGEQPWEFPGGRLLPRESPEAAARRICGDMLGTRLEIHLGQPPFVYNYGTHSVTYRYFFCGAIGRPEPAGCAELRWVIAGQLRDYVFEPASQQVADWLVQSADNDRSRRPEE